MACTGSRPSSGRGSEEGPRLPYRRIIVGTTSVGHKSSPRGGRVVYTCFREGSEDGTKW